MVERKRELDRHYQRRQKLLKLRKKLAMAKTDAARALALAKIKSVSPRWTEPPKP